MPQDVDGEDSIIFVDPKSNEEDGLSGRVIRQIGIAWPSEVIELKGEVGRPVQLELKLQPEDEE